MAEHPPAHGKKWINFLFAYSAFAFPIKLCLNTLALYLLPSWFCPQPCWWGSEQAAAVWGCGETTKNGKGQGNGFVTAFCQLLVKPTIADPRGNAIPVASGEVCFYQALLKAQIDGSTIPSCSDISLRIPGDWSKHWAVKWYLSVNLCSNQLFMWSGARTEAHPGMPFSPRAVCEGCCCPHHCLGIPSDGWRVPVLPLSGAGRVVCVGRIGLGWSDLLSFLRWNYSFSEIKTAYAYVLHNKNKCNKAPAEINTRVAAFQRRWAVTKGVPWREHTYVLFPWNLN